MNDWPTDYRAALERAALFDRTGTGLVRAEGPDAARFLHAISSNDILALQPGHGSENFFLDHRGKVLHRVQVICESKESFLLSTDLGRGAALFAHLDKFLISERLELSDVSETNSVLHVAGPLAIEVLKSSITSGVTALPLLHSLMNGEVRVRRHDPLGVTGIDLIGGIDAIASLKSIVNAANGTTETWDTLRIEALTPAHGIDFDDTRFVLELPAAAEGISYTKGCFPGQEPIVMSRDRAGFVNRALMRVTMHGPVHCGEQLLTDGRAIGVVTSITHSPRLQATLALAYLQRGFQEPGMTFTTANGTTATVTA